MRPNRSCKLDDVLNSPKGVDFKTLGTSVDVTKEVQHAFTNYFSVFGTKMIDFNPDVSAFRNLRQLIGEKQAEKLLEASAPYADGNKYKLESPQKGMLE